MTVNISNTSVVPQLNDMNLEPIRIIEVELSQPLSNIPAVEPQTGRYYRRIRILARLHGRPLGLVDVRLDSNELEAGACAEAIWRTLGEAINAHLREDNLPEVAGLQPAGLPCRDTPPCLQERESFLARAPLVTVIVCTRDRTEQLDNCLQSLLALQYPHYEVLVVDNAPRTLATADLIQQRYGHLPKVRYVREDRPGLPWARNCGLMEANTDIIVYTDDDIIADPHWLAEIVKGFEATNDIACVSGLTIPNQLESSAEQWFEQLSSFTNGFTRVIHNTHSRRMTHPLYPYNAIKYGAGVNVAYRARIIRQLSGFDPIFFNGQDIELYFRVNVKGYTMVYEPGALLYHSHRSEYSKLHKQLYNYGAAFAVFLVKSLIIDPGQIPHLISRLPQVAQSLLKVKSGQHAENGSYSPKEIARIRWRGMLAGPIWYAHQRWQTHQIVKRFGPLRVSPR
jgi:glycosyltransferase involved in cell wall biosynthesis